MNEMFPLFIYLGVEKPSETLIAAPGPDHCTGPQCGGLFQLMDGVERETDVTQSLILYPKGHTYGSYGNRSVYIMLVK